MTRQMPYEPLPASVLLGVSVIGKRLERVGGRIGKLLPERVADELLDWRERFRNTTRNALETSVESKQRLPLGRSKERLQPMVGGIKIVVGPLTEKLG